MAFAQLLLLRTQLPVLQTVTMCVLADPTVQDVSVVLMDVGEAVEPVHPAEHVLELEDVSVTETVSERNAEMMVVILEMSVTSVELLKFVGLTSDVLEFVPLTAETQTEPSEFAVTMDVLVLAENVLQFRVKIFDAEMDSVSADPNVTTSNVVLMVAEETVEHVPVMLPASTEHVFSQLWAAVEMVYAKLLLMRQLAAATPIVGDVVLMESVKRNSERPNPTVSKIVLRLCSLKSERERVTFLFKKLVPLLSLDPTATLLPSPTVPPPFLGNSKLGDLELTPLLQPAPATLVQLRQLQCLIPPHSLLSLWD